MKIFIKRGRQEDTEEFNMLESFQDFIYQDVDDILAVAFDEYVDSNFFGCSVFGDNYSGSQVLKCCDEENYAFEFDAWFNDTTSYAWDKLDRDGFTYIGKIELELVEEEE